MYSNSFSNGSGFCKSKYLKPGRSLNLSSISQIVILSPYVSQKALANDGAHTKHNFFSSSSGLLTAIINEDIIWLIVFLVKKYCSRSLLSLKLSGMKDQLSSPSPTLTEFSSNCFFLINSSSCSCYWSCYYWSSLCY